MARGRATALAIVTVMLLTACSGEKRAIEPTPSDSVPQPPSTPRAPTGTPAPATSTPTPSTTLGVTTTPTPTASAPGRRVFRYQPAWPFTSEADAAAWQ